MSSPFAPPQIPDDGEDAPIGGSLQSTPTPPPIVFGAATFANYYNSDSYLSSATPLQTVRLALRYGVCAFDTAPLYAPSETILGNALEAVAPEFPRSSYKLMTKCGRYGTDLSSFDYSPARIRASVNTSLRRLKTTYLDTVYLHDVEFMCTQVGPRSAGNPSVALREGGGGEFGLAEGDEGKVWGEGDRAVLDAVAELRKMQDEGLITNIGISGYPLPTLLRLALLVLHTPPFKPLDLVLSFAHLTLQNSAFEDFIPHFRERARVKELVAASPLSMALLTPNPPPWHPAPKELREVVAREIEAGEVASWPGRLPNLALGYSIRKAIGAGVRLAVGLSSPSEVHECMKVWTEEVSEGVDKGKRRGVEGNVRGRIGQAGFLDWSWVI